MDPELREYMSMMRSQSTVDYKKQIKVCINYFQRGIKIFTMDKDMIINEILETTNEIKGLSSKLIELQNSLYESQRKSTIRRIENQIKECRINLKAAKMDKYLLERQKKYKEERIQQCKDNIKKLPIC